VFPRKRFFKELLKMSTAVRGTHRAAGSLRGGVLDVPHSTSGLNLQTPPSLTGVAPQVGRQHDPDSAPVSRVP